MWRMNLFTHTQIEKENFSCHFVTNCLSEYSSELVNSIHASTCSTIEHLPIPMTVEPIDIINLQNASIAAKQ